MRRLVAIAALAVLGAGAVPRAEPPTPWDGIYTIAQSDRGRLQYRQHCARCHGQFLEGRYAPPPALPPDITPGMVVGWEIKGMTPALSGAPFLANWTGLAVADLFERMRVSMPQNAPGSLSRQQNADILAFILERNGYPAGLRELPQDVAGTGPVTFTGW
jgi:mono/diheme cytochrome c family protein